MFGTKKRKVVRESNVNTDQVKLAVPALFAYLEKKKKKKTKKLFDENTAFWILLSVKKIPAPDKKPKLVHLPNSFNDETEVCLFTKLPGKQIKEKLKENEVTSITKVISLTKLKKEYKSFEQKRVLCSQYGIFLCDNNIYHLLPKYLGKTFFSQKKEPTPINLNKADIKKEINKALESTRVRFGHGSCSAVKVGHSGQTQEQLIENVVAAIAEIAKIVPRGWSNIQSVHLKTSESVALPLYNSLPDIENVIESTEPPTKRKKKNKE